MLRVAVIGVGNMGSKYAQLLQDNKIEGACLAALTRVKEPYRTMLSPAIDSGIPVYESADLLFDAVEAGTLKLDAVIIVTPHYFHEQLAVRAFKNGLNVLSDKPSGVYLRQAVNMNQAADAANKVFALVFNQRTKPIYKRIKEIVDSKKYGELKRVNWVVTDWYRPEKYYTTAAWRGTYKTDGGGVLLNQAPHNIDLLQWICGMPTKIQGFCHEGRFHDIEVEDDVTAYFEWANKASGVFITSTGDAPGINRLEISLDEAMLVCENGKLKINELEPVIHMKEKEYRKTSEDLFKKLNGTWIEEELPPENDQYVEILSNFVAACVDDKTSLVANGREGYNSLLISNAVYLSSWTGKMIEVPKAGSIEEIEFMQQFEDKLNSL